MPLRAPLFYPFFTRYFFSILTISLALDWSNKGYTVLGAESCDPLSPIYSCRRLNWADRGLEGRLFCGKSRWPITLLSELYLPIKISNQDVASMRTWTWPNRLPMMRILTTKREFYRGAGKNAVMGDSFRGAETNKRDGQGAECPMLAHV